MDSDFILRAFLVFVVTMVAFVVWEVKAASPLLPRRLFTNPNVILSLVAMAFVSMAAYGVFLMLPVYLQKLKGFTTLQAGLIMLPGSLAAAVTTLLSGVLSDRLPPKWVGSFFLLCMFITTWQFRTGFYEPRSAAVWDNFFWGLAMGGVFTPLFVIMLASLPQAEFSDASMVMNVVRLVFGSVGTAYATNVFTNRSASFYDALASRVEVSSPAATELLLRLGGSTGGQGFFVPEAETRVKASIQTLLQAMASGEAFQATWRHLALWSLLALGATLLLRSVRGQGQAPLH
uniref:MFS transporter n=1 Tax=Thermoanaerobaculum aquaticum TaxID=1312852 RepID=A0A7C2NFV6_9BACT